MRYAISASVVLLAFVSACGSEHGDAAAPPVAPTNLVVSNVGGGGHLAWKDNSDNEDHFMVQRKPMGGAYDDVAMVDFNGTQYHDSSVAAGITYVYQIMAMNAAGETSSNEVMFTP
ncbi:MAG: fibronectin type III domain-containing protein [Kofleriaceae bacterium]